MNERKLFESSFYDQTKSMFSPITKFTDRTTSSVETVRNELTIRTKNII